MNDFATFTEEGFRALLRQLKASGYHFARYHEGRKGRHVIWRHDVDCSMHRAARLAEIEAEEDALATYFVNPHCAFYNLLEPEVAARLAKIRGLGHEVGLHFDAAVYSATMTRENLDGALRRERHLLETILNAAVQSVSWHNPDESNLLEFQDDEVGGLLNVYGASLQREYVYCSDSNGYWRYTPMGEVIAQGNQRLHLLTHPEWWTPEPMSPSARIDRAIMGRARAVRRDYDTLLAAGGRRNVVG
jgi:hypothetical protein